MKKVKLFQTIPDELVLIFFCNLEREEVLEMRCVSKRYNSLIASDLGSKILCESLWGELFTRQSSRKNYDSYFEMYLKDHHKMFCDFKMKRITDFYEYDMPNIMMLEHYDLTWKRFQFCMLHEFDFDGSEERELDQKAGEEAVDKLFEKTEDNPHPTMIWIGHQDDNDMKIFLGADKCFRESDKNAPDPIFPVLEIVMRYCQGNRGGMVFEGTSFKNNMFMLSAQNVWKKKPDPKFKNVHLDHRYKNETFAFSKLVLERIRAMVEDFLCFKEQYGDPFSLDGSVKEVEDFNHLEARKWLAENNPQ